MNRSAATLLAAVVLFGGAGCRTGQPLYDSTGKDKATPGTIAGTVRAVGGDPLPGRQVHAVREGTSERYSAVTSATGGFSIPVPPGKYRLEVVLREGETLVRQPGVIDINKSDLDANLEIVVGS
jgi:hypothetical protein